MEELTGCRGRVMKFLIKKTSNTYRIEPNAALLVSWYRNEPNTLTAILWLGGSPPEDPKTVRLSAPPQTPSHEGPGSLREAYRTHITDGIPETGRRRPAPPPGRRQRILSVAAGRGATGPSTRKTGPGRHSLAPGPWFTTERRLYLMTSQLFIFTDCKQCQDQNNNREIFLQLKKIF